MSHTRWLVLFIAIIVVCGAIVIGVSRYRIGISLRSSVQDTSPTPEVTASSSLEPSASPTLSPRELKITQGVSVANQVEVVSPGTGLLTIVDRYDVNLSTLAKLNGISDVDKVITGQAIVIPDDVSNDTLTILFILNTSRYEKEKSSIADGKASLYTDPITAVQADAKGLYGLDASIPWSRTDQSATQATLATSNDERVMTFTLRQSEGLWIIEKAIIKQLTKEES